MDLHDVSIREVGLDHLPIVETLNHQIFGDRKVLMRMNREDLTLLLAFVDEDAVGYKVGYMGTEEVFYSAKGGILPPFRRHGIARMLLYEMMKRAREKGYQRFVFDTFPNKHPGMTIMALQEGFRVIQADLNRTYADFCIRFSKKL